MERKEKVFENPDGTNTTFGVTKTTPEDGFVSEYELRKNPFNYGKYKKGYSVNYSFSSSDPRVTAPIMIVISCLLFWGACYLFNFDDFFMLLFSLLIMLWSVMTVIDSIKRLYLFLKNKDKENR